jgi:dienelactone hydrolase
MNTPKHLRFVTAGTVFVSLTCFGATARTQIGTAVIEKHKAGLERQITDPDQKREGGTQPRDWEYQLGEGVRTRQVTFFVDGGVPLYGKLFLPKGFTAAGRYPAVVVGHGINALSIGIEKFAARFAERGLVAMAIDYQSYGFSGSGSDDIRLLEPHGTTDAAAVTEGERRILLKRTNLNNVHEIADFRAAISFLQGEPGVDPERIGIWGSSNGGAVVMAVAAADARVKAVVSQVSSPRPAARGPVALGANLQQDAITRVRTGQGGEVDGGFSFKSKIDAWSSQRNRDVRPGTTLDQIRPTTAVLLIPAEKDELTGGAAGAIEAAKLLSERGVPSQAIVLPGLSHFQAYSYTGFEIGSTLAADWFTKYLAAATPPAASKALPALAPPPAIATAGVVPGGVTARDVAFFSEAVPIHGRLFLPGGFNTSGAAAAVVLAPGWGDTAASIEVHAAQFAAKGVAALAIDYRGWGKSGGFVYLADNTRWDDRLRFSQHTSKVRIRRKRLLPEAQVIDIRNAITFLQGEPGVDPARIGVWGVGVSGGHVVAVAATDARVKTAVAVMPVIAGKDTPRESFNPSPAQRNVMVRLARSGRAPATQAAAVAMNADETSIALAEYRPFNLMDQIPKTTQILYLDSAENAAKAAAEWFVKHL